MLRIWTLVTGFAVVAAAVTVLAQPAAAEWRTHDVRTHGAADVEDIDGLPGGPVATLLQRSTGPRDAALELWIGDRHTVVAAHGTFRDGKIAHDARGRVVVVFVRAGTVYVWTAAHGDQRVATGFNSFSGSLDVAGLTTALQGITDKAAANKK